MLRLKVLPLPILRLSLPANRPTHVLHHTLGIHITGRRDFGCGPQVVAAIPFHFLDVPDSIEFAKQISFPSVVRAVGHREPGTYAAAVMNSSGASSNFVLQSCEQK
jgi:hypothetical protein